MMSNLLEALRSAVARGLPHRVAPRLVRRVEVRCPATRGPARIDVVEDADPERRRVVRCSLLPECPPGCDLACAVHAGSAPVVAHLVFGEGSTWPEDQD